LRSDAASGSHPIVNLLFRFRALVIINKRATDYSYLEVGFYMKDCTMIRKLHIILALAAIVLFVAMMPVPSFAGDGADEEPSVGLGAWFNEAGGPRVIDIAQGETAQLVTTYPGEITYSSSNSAVATIDENGKITYAGLGVTQIWVKVDGSNYDYLILYGVREHKIAFYPEKGSSYDTARIEGLFRNWLGGKLSVNGLEVVQNDDHFDITLHAIKDIHGYDITRDGGFKNLYYKNSPATGRVCTYEFGYRPLEEYNDISEIRKDYYSSDVLPTDRTLNIYTLIEMPIDSVDVTIKAPVPGTKITFDYNTGANVMPDVSIPSSANYLLHVDAKEDGNYAFWFDGNVSENDDDIEPFSGVIEKGKSYLALVMVVPKLGYYFPSDIDKANVRVNGEPAERFSVENEYGDYYDGGLMLMAHLTAGNSSSGSSSYDLSKGVTGAPIAAVEEALLNRKSDSDLAGSEFTVLKAKAYNIKKTSQVIKWNKVDGAVEYRVYASKCGIKNKVKQIAVTGKTSYPHKKLKKGTYYKYVIMAVDGNGNIITASKMIHSATKGGKVTNAKSIKTAAKKKAVKVKAGKSFKLKAKAVPVSKKLKIKTHRKIQYVSADPAIATVSSKGTIKGVGAGITYVYAYAQNGVYTRIKVTVE